MYIVMERPKMEKSEGDRARENTRDNVAFLVAAPGSCRQWGNSGAAHGAIDGNCPVTSVVITLSVREIAFPVHHNGSRRKCKMLGEIWILHE